MSGLTLKQVAPYVGLRPFTELEALFFFGRDLHVRDLLVKLESRQRFISIVGASGTGKSSLVRAGLIPALHRGALATAGHSWNVCIISPGDAPLANLAHALTEDERWVDNGDRALSASALSAALASSPLALAELYSKRFNRVVGQALLLVVDQFEEIFRYRQRNLDEAESFIRLLLRSASEDVPIYVVVTMRSDFLGNCVAFFGLPEAINSGVYLTPRLGYDPLRSVIGSPLGLVGGTISPVLVSRLINTIGGEDELPVLEHALLRMWNRARADGRNRIDDIDFEAVCAPDDQTGNEEGAPQEAAESPKLAFALNNHASEIYHALPSECQGVARCLFLALVERRENRVVRHPQELRHLFELVGSRERENLLAVLSAFRADGVGFLLPPAREPVSDDTLVDISHESLFRQWSRFQLWIEDERLDVAELNEWRQRAIRQRERGGWLDERDCDRAVRWRERVSAHGDVTVWAERYAGEGAYALVHRYIEASLERLGHERDERERLEREANEAKLQKIEAEFALQKSAADRAEQEKQQAEHEKRLAEAFAVASRRKSLIASVCAVLSLLFALIAGALAWQAMHSKQEAIAGELAANAENVGRDHPDQGLLLALAAWKVSPTPKAESIVRLSEINFPYKLVLRGHRDSVLGLQFSQEGKTLDTVGQDSTAHRWDVQSGKEIGVLNELGRVVGKAKFSPDDRTLATVDDGDNTVRLRNMQDPSEGHVLKGHKDTIQQVQFSPDGRILATASRDASVRLWDAYSGELRRTLSLGSATACLTFSSDSKLLATTGPDNTAQLWDVQTGGAMQSLKGHTYEIHDIQFSPDGKTMATVSGDKTIRLWNVQTGKELIVLHGQDDAVNLIQFSPAGDRLATTGFDNTLRLSDSRDGSDIHTWTLDEKITSLRFSKDGKVLAVGRKDGAVQTWDTDSGRALQMLLGHEDVITDIQFSPDNNTLATASRDTTVRLWDVIGDRQLRGHRDDVYSVQFSPDDQTLLTAGKDGTARLWDVHRGKEILVLQGHTGAVISARFSGDGKTLATASADATARLWDRSTGRVLLVLGRHKDAVTAIDFSRDGHTFATASLDGMARLWDVRSGRELQMMSHQDAVNSVQFSPDSKLLATASNDGTAVLWDAQSGRKLQMLSGHEGAVTDAKFSPDGKMLATAGQDGTARLWNTYDGRELLMLRGHEDAVTDVQFSFDGEILATASADGSARLWDVHSGKELRNLWHGDAVSRVRFSADANTLATATDKSARLWDVRSGRELEVLSGQQGIVHDVQFSSDGRMLATGSGDGTAQLWTCEACRSITEVVSRLTKAVGRSLTPDERRRFGVPE
ncbi:hypothetical protein CBA19CS22_17795 [Caballeronia novacaledonica]|uniref:Uncharacterized protein n=1 Tax=Caballeronia novacaledonica TaxID=1544861 RepID=A0ACB5QTI0_9BURK|nr:hypothetical protein CBA19CS22_17795 [Caballeronia novacaledonica]